MSFLLVTRNEIKYIERALLSMIDQTYPHDLYEILVVDGRSDDGTIEKIKDLKKQHYNDALSIRVLDNPKRILASGWNIGIKEAKGEYVIRIDAHAQVPANFLESAVKAIMQTSAVCVGGKLKSVSLDGNDNIVSKVLSSPFGVGNSSFRVSDIPGYVDTVVYGLYRKNVFDEIGYFDETLVRNQDIELHSRIKKAGYKFYFDPAIESTYYTRNTIKKMLKQAYGNGLWNMVLLKRGTNALSIRHLVPFAFLITLIAGFILSFWWPVVGMLCLVLVFLHIFLGIFFATQKTKNIKQIVQMPILFMGLHLTYGFGYLAGLMRK